ncbi:hypothetical protein C0Q70_02118 [Pomacea canaliculata]|uniref:CCHC-type domain-containing protein n=1 Tax=Pomacea canaliculata TaxID=400727 RepID=A0A2T7Q1E5_POMCA|nr:hypothetical protein C0Q70_02118 [Pomacea canaliculata]
MILTSKNNGEPSAVKVSQRDEKNSSSEDCCFQHEAPGPSDDDLRNTVEVPTTSKRHWCSSTTGIDPVIWLAKDFISSYPALPTEEVAHPDVIDMFSDIDTDDEDSDGDGSRKERIPEVFTGTKGDFKDWLRHFETAARWNDWDYAEKGVNLAMCLRALERRFDPVERESLKRVEFRSRFKKKGESVTEYGFVLNRLAASAYPNMPSEAREIIVIDPFVSGLPSKDLRRHVQFNHPSSIHEAVALASEFESFDEKFESRKPENEEAVRSIGKDTSEHELLKAFQNLSKLVCSTLEQLSEKVVDKKNRGKDRSGPVTCYRCGKEGHISRHCPDPVTRAHNENARGVSEN